MSELSPSKKTTIRSQLKNIYKNLISTLRYEQGRWLKISYNVALCKCADMDWITWYANEDRWDVIQLVIISIGLIHIILIATIVPISETILVDVAFLILLIWKHTYRIFFNFSYIFDIYIYHLTSSPLNNLSRYLKNIHCTRDKRKNSYTIPLNNVLILRTIINYGNSFLSYLK